MKNLIKVMSILVISVMVVLFTTTVNAANDDGFKELTINTSNTNSENSSTNSNTNNTNSNTNTNTENKNTNNTNANKNTNNSSIYKNTNKNTDLPKTGIEDSIPVAMLVVVFGISAVYAYKKINEYKNI